MSVEQTAGVWIAILVGAVTALGTLYGIYHTWQQWRQDRVHRLSQAALLAVRRTEATFVRPILRERLRTAVLDFLIQHPDHAVDLRMRMLLFCELQRSVGLTEEEKRTAHTTAVNHLVTILRTVPAPPLHVHSDANVRRHNGRLGEQIENAYSVRPRPSATLIEQLGRFVRPTASNGGA